MKDSLRRLRAKLPSLTAILAGGLLLLLGSPLILAAMGALVHLDWTQLSEIGQSYTGIAALISGAALLGVAYSIRLQTQQIVVARSQAIRQMQFRLLQMEMDDPGLSIFSMPLAETDPAGYRKYVYRTQWLRYLEFGYLSGEMNKEGLLAILKLEFFSSSANREHWQSVRPLWISEFSSLRENRQFLQIVDASLALAEDDAAASTTDDLGAGMK